MGRLILTEREMKGYNIYNKEDIFENWNLIPEEEIEEMKNYKEDEEEEIF